MIKPMKEVILGFDRPGILGKLDLQEGDSVVAGQLLASLKDDVARAALVVAQIQADSDAEVVYAELAVDVARLDHEAMVNGNLKKPNTTPELEVRRARLNHDKMIAELEKARLTRDVLIAKRDEAQAQLDTFRLDAPFDGFITKLHLVTGASVKQGDPVIELVHSLKVRVEGNVPVRDIALVKKGCPVVVQLEAKKGTDVGEEALKRTYSGTIKFVDEARVTAGAKVRVWAEVENPDMLLRAGLLATMKIGPARDSD
jgi:membrane fusion protein (multidrug efflux system)